MQDNIRSSTKYTVNCLYTCLTLVCFRMKCHNTFQLKTLNQTTTRYVIRGSGTQYTYTDDVDNVLTQYQAPAVDHCFVCSSPT